MPKITENIFPLEWNISDNLIVPKNNKKVLVLNNYNKNKIIKTNKVKNIKLSKE